jgi:BirA family biotin operon repressor/biotin-[acetyl-CoA-carboxylase] ligase
MDCNSPGQGVERDDLIIERLRAAEGQFVSGTELARLLGVSRAAVGKRVLSLRRRGWGIEAVPNRGYRLVAEADSLEPVGVTPLLGTEWLGRLYLPHDELTSTNAGASRMAEEGAPHGTVVLADTQSAGRGRMGRSWFSPPGVNLYFSVILRPEIESSDAPLLSLASAVGVADGVRGFVGRPPTVKWPNDLLYRGRKFCGILLEMSAQGGRVRHVVLGVGINVNITEFPAELQQTATSLQLERGTPLRRAALLASVLNSLEDWIDRLAADGPSPIVEAWLDLADWIGKSIVVNLPDGQVTGVALGIDRSGALQFKGEDGQEHRLLTGVLEVPSECDECD